MRFNIIWYHINIKERKRFPLWSVSLTNGKLAELAGVKQSNAARIENGPSVPTLTTMQKILEPLGGADS